MITRSGRPGQAPVEDLRRAVRAFAEQPPGGFLEAIADINALLHRRPIEHSELNARRDIAAQTFAGACGVHYSSARFAIKQVPAPKPYKKWLAWREHFGAMTPLRFSNGYGGPIFWILDHPYHFRIARRPAMLVGMPYDNREGDVAELTRRGLIIERLPNELSWWYPGWTRFFCIFDPAEPLPPRPSDPAPAGGVLLRFPVRTPARPSR
jgi:hypothetical protein